MAAQQTRLPGPGLARWGRPKEPHRLFWVALAAPGIIWLLVLFVVPFYTMVAIAAGYVNPVFGYPVAVWNPLNWSSANLSAAWRDLAGTGAFVGPIVVRTLVYVAIASLLALLIAYPTAYFVARFAGRRKGLFLVLLIAPFWISYMMRMLAWVGLLQNDGYVNKALGVVSLGPVNWLSGLPMTVILGLVYGYIPYLILVLYAGLDRIDPALIEAGRDLGLGRVRTFLRVTLPMSRQAILTGMLITVLPMLGDYYTNQLLSGTTGTTMLGNVINNQLSTPGLQGEGAVFSLFFLLALMIPMIYYVVRTNRTSREAM
ncbi:MAG TPA: ABC transporter permease [Streptosporangiaceae bacterium]|nr:ABC transporter permease [Streptosporangiaceae bacterium]